MTQEFYNKKLLTDYCVINSAFGEILSYSVNHISSMSITFIYENLARLVFFFQIFTNKTRFPSNYLIKQTLNTGTLSYKNLFFLSLISTNIFQMSNIKLSFKFLSYFCIFFSYNLYFIKNAFLPTPFYIFTLQKKLEFRILLRNYPNI